MKAKSKARIESPKPLSKKAARGLALKQAEIFALLANVASLKDDLKQSQKEKLCEDVRNAGLLESELTTYPEIRFVTEDEDLIESFGNPYVPKEWLPIKTVHPWVYQIINSLIQDGRADLTDFEKELPKPTLKLDKDTGQLVRWYELGAYTDKELLFRLARILSGQFNFRRCQLCSMVFVRRGKQRYCSRQCTDKAAGSRNDYMKLYMRKVRAKKKREARQQSKKQ